MKENKTEFKVGDIVEAFGCRGTVVEIISPNMMFPVVVIFDGNEGKETFFSLCGMEQMWHKEPSLKLIERPKQKKKIKLYPAVSKYYHNGEEAFCLSTMLFKSEFEAKSCSSIAFICLAENLGVEIEADV